MSLVSIVVVLLIAGLLLWAVGQFPIDATIARIIRVVVVVVVVLWLLQAFGLFHGTGIHLN
jgi:type IV secretory pathway TrbL component